MKSSPVLTLSFSLSVFFFFVVWSVDRRVYSGIPLIQTRGVLGKDLSQTEEPPASVGENNFPWVMERAVILHYPPAGCK